MKILLQGVYCLFRELTANCRSFLFSGVWVMKKYVFAAGAVLATAAVGTIGFLCGSKTAAPLAVSSENVSKESKNVVVGTGFVRGIGQRTLKNKYASYVSKVNFYSQQRVKKGDVILEYDDYDLRCEITRIRNDIAEQTQLIRQQKLLLALTKLDPLPSEYRNLKLKKEIAQERLNRHSHELEVYEQLFGSKIVSDLSLREKRQLVKDYEGDLRCLNSDMNILQAGLSDLLVQSDAEKLQAAEIKLASLKNELALLEEKRKYYKIISPIDGLCITNSDAVGGYDAVGTSAAIVHNDRQKIIYGYFEERDIKHVTEGKECRFYSNQYGSGSNEYKVMPYEVKRTFYSYGDRMVMMAKFKILSEPQPLRIDSIGTIKINIDR